MAVERPAARSAASPALTRRVLSPLAVHLATLVVAAAIIAFLGRRQFFFYDEWAFLIPDGPGVFDPHGGHWTLVPEVVYHLLRSIVGVDTYWPYFALVIVIHLLMAHLLWRVMIRSRVEPWIATALAGLMLLFGAGAENIFWAFQFCFIGAACCGLGALLLVTRERFGVWSGVLSAVVTLVGFATAGTSLPVTLLAIIVSLRFRGLWTTVRVFVVPVVIYLIWYAAKHDETTNVTPHGLRETLLFVPRYAGRMFAEGFDTAVPVPAIGGVLLVGVLLVVGIRSARIGERDHVLPIALVLAAAVFAALTAYTRFGSGIEAASSSRYVYLITALCLPAMGVGATALARGRIAPRLVAIVLVLVTTAFNLGLLMDAARSQAKIEQGTRRQIFAALDFIRQHPGQANPLAAVDAKWTHALTPGGLLGLYRHGWIKPGHYRTKDRLNALVDIATRVLDDTGTTACTAAADVPVKVAAAESLVFEHKTYGRITVRITDGTTLSRTRVYFAQAGRFRIANTSDETMLVTELPSHSTLCPSV